MFEGFLTKKFTICIKKINNQREACTMKTFKEIMMFLRPTHRPAYGTFFFFPMQI